MFKIIESRNLAELQNDMNKFAKNHTINGFHSYIDSYGRHVVIIEWYDTREERISKLDDIISTASVPITSSMVTWIDKMFNHSFSKKWYTTYWGIDLHGTVLFPTNRDSHTNMVYYPYAKETLLLLSNRPDIKLIMSTSSYPEEIEFYNKSFIENGIVFDYINKNPEIDSSKGSFGYYDDKYYLNVLLDDKAGFCPETDWKQIYNLLLSYQSKKFLPDINWNIK